MKVLVTGGAGFLGSHVCEFYAKTGARVVAYDSLTKFELSRTGYKAQECRDHSRKFLESLGVRVLIADLSDAPRLMEEIERADFVVHTAAQPAMTLAIQNPRMDLMVNAIGTFNMLDFCLRLGVPMVTCSTIHVYGTWLNAGLLEKADTYASALTVDESQPIQEGSLTPLHVSKAAGDLYAQAYINCYGLCAAVFRLTGIYGPRQFGGEDHGWVANFAIRLLTGKPISIYGTGKQARDIIYVSDVCQAVEAWRKGASKATSGVYNIGGGQPCMTSLLQCIQKLEGITGRKAEVKFEPGRQGDLLWFCSDTAKARDNLGWEPKVLPDEGLPRLVEWVGSNLDLFA